MVQQQGSQRQAVAAGCGGSCGRLGRAVCQAARLLQGMLRHSGAEAGVQRRGAGGVRQGCVSATIQQHPGRARVAHWGTEGEGCASLRVLLVERHAGIQQLPCGNRRRLLAAMKHTVVEGPARPKRRRACQEGGELLQGVPAAGGSGRWRCTGGRFADC